MTFRKLIYATVIAVSVMVFSGCSSRTGEELLSVGMEKLDRGQHAQAASLLEQAVIRLPSSAVAQCSLGIAYWKLNRNEEAVAAFRTASELNEQETVPLEYIARILKDSKDLDGARTALKEAAVRLPGSPRIMTAMAVVDLEADNTYVAYDFLIKALEIDPDYPPALYNLARLYREKMNNNIMAAKFYEKYIEIADQSVSEEERVGFEARVELAKRFLEAHLAGKTVDPAPEVKPEPEPEPVPEIEPDPDDGAVAEAAAAVEKGEIDRALLLLKAAVKKNPEDADSLWALAVLYDKNLNFESRADKYYRQFAARFPGDPRVRGQGDAARPAETANAADPADNGSATAKSDESKVDSGSEVKRDDLDPNRVAIELRTRGLQCHNKKDFEGAIRYYRQSLEYNSKDFTAIFNLGLAYMDNKEFAPARDMFTEALKIRPGFPQANCMLGCSYAELGDTARAIEYLNRAHRKNPDHLEANYYLGQLYAQLKKYDMSRTHLEHCVELEPDSPEGKNAKVLLESIPEVQKPGGPR